jgi:DNA-binding LacI/PurR family transcriptional regulator
VKAVELVITILELAKLAGVSDATVSMVLTGKGRVSPTRREQILELARQHGYRTNPAARALAQGRTNRIGLCIAGTITRHAMIGEFSLHARLDLFAEGLQRAGYAIEIVQADPAQTPEELSRNLREHAVDGLVFLNWPRDLLERPLFSLRERGLPAVASGTAFTDGGFTWTDVDASASMEDAVLRLSREGRLRLALIDTVIGGRPAWVEPSFKRAMHRCAGVSPEHVLLVRPVNVDYEGARDATLTVLQRQPDVQGILLPDNYLAPAVLNALRVEGRRPGADVRVIGYGDTVFADQCRPKLSHYSLRLEEQVRFGLSALLEQIQDNSGYQPRHAYLAPEYIARET